MAPMMKELSQVSNASASQVYVYAKKDEVPRVLGGLELQFFLPRNYDGQSSP